MFLIEWPRSDIRMGVCEKTATVHFIATVSSLGGPLCTLKSVFLFLFSFGVHSLCRAYFFSYLDYL